MEFFLYLKKKCLSCCDLFCRQSQAPRPRRGDFRVIGIVDQLFVWLRTVGSGWSTQVLHPMADVYYVTRQITH